MAPNPSMMVMLLAVPTLLGLWLIVTGWRGRRVGEEPRCARCNYVLLHLESQQCPECGTAILEANTVVGERKRRWGRLAAGMVLLLVAILGMVPQVTRTIAAVPWYQYKPAGYVLDDLDTPGTFLKAITELERRERAGELSERVRRKLVEKALKEQALTNTSPRGELLDYLGVAALVGWLTEAEKEQFLDQSCRVTMTVRPIVGEGDEVPFYVWEDRRLPGTSKPTSGFWMRHEIKELRIDGKTVQNGGSSGQSSGSGRGGSGSSRPAGGVGKHTIEADIAWTVWDGAFGDRANSRNIGTRSKTASITYEVVPPDQAPKIALLDSEELRAQVLKAIKLTRVSRQKDGYLHVHFDIAAAPCDLAFEVVMRTDQGETPLGSIGCVKGQTTGYGTGGSAEKGAGRPAKVKVQLRSSLDVAKKTVGITAIYSGEITFPGVEIEQNDY